MTEKSDETVPKIDRRTRLAALARYVRVFTAPGFEFATWPEFRSDGERCSPLDECLMGPEASSFIEEAYAYGWVDREFDYNSRASREEFIAFVTNPSSIAQATEGQMRKILTCFICQDRLCEGTLAAAFANGHLTALARRAETLLNGERQVARLLSADFEEALLGGVLNPVLSLAHEDKDVILEIRENYVDLYCKGNILFEVKKAENDYLIAQPDKAFSDEPSFLAGSRNELQSFIEQKVPFIKQRIACHKPKGSELEFEQAILRAANFEKSHPDYLIVDRQVSTPGRSGQIDCVGIYWANRASSEAFPVLCEIKYLAGAVSYMPSAIQQYYEYISANFDLFKHDLESLFHQKARLGLFPGLSKDAQAKLDKVKIVGGIDKLEIVVALVDHSPKAAQDYLGKLAEMSFHKQITIQKLGFAMWKKNGIPVLREIHDA